MSYGAIHLRIKQQRGPAVDYLCIDCGRQAHEWSYDRTDPNQKVDPKTGAPYSYDLDRYDPRCRNCHRLHDSKRRSQCTVDDCERPAQGKGLCGKHYQRMRYVPRWPDKRRRAA